MPGVLPPILSCFVAYRSAARKDALRVRGLHNSDVDSVLGFAETCLVLPEAKFLPDQIMQYMIADRG